MITQPSLPSIGKYEILAKIGEGGFGVVYRGRDPMLDRQVAIKVLRSDLATDPGFIERFRREARLAASLRHPNIVTVIEVGEQEGRYYLVMEFLEGQSLKELLEEGKPLPLTRAVELLRPLAEALDYAHSRSVIHRDVKPANVLFAEEGKPVLTDFGLVKSTLEEGMTTTGVVLGTPEYMAPEQIRGQEPGPATDLYALGVIAYQMLTGRVPFKGTTPFEVQNGHVSQPPPDPCSLNPALPPEIAATLLTALAKEPADRFSRAVEFVTILDRLITEFIQQQATRLIQEAQAAMEKMEFADASSKIEQVLAFHSTSEAKNLLRESQRRQNVWVEVEELRNQKEQAAVRLSQLSAAELWLPKTAQPAIPAAPSYSVPARFTLAHSIITVGSLGLLIGLFHMIRYGFLIGVFNLTRMNIDRNYEIAGAFLLAFSVGLILTPFLQERLRRQKTKTQKKDSDPTNLASLAAIATVVGGDALFLGAFQMIYDAIVLYHTPTFFIPPLTGYAIFLLTWLGTSFALTCLGITFWLLSHRKLPATH